mmetsp:Transcript_23300/g.66279  ORF Transcript_23300/g.66279 Transcript_23300/m.66279 type:complete len:237 (-) Transcript_23300:154-864(-)
MILLALPCQAPVNPVNNSKTALVNAQRSEIQGCCERVFTQNRREESLQFVTHVSETPFVCPRLPLGAEPREPLAPPVKVGKKRLVRRSPDRDGHVAARSEAEQHGRGRLRRAREVGAEGADPRLRVSPRELGADPLALRHSQRCELPPRRGAHKLRICVRAVLRAQRDPKPPQLSPLFGRGHQLLPGRLEMREVQAARLRCDVAAVTMAHENNSLSRSLRRGWWACTGVEASRQCP